MTGNSADTRQGIARGRNDLVGVRGPGEQWGDTLRSLSEIDYYAEVTVNALFEIVPARSGCSAGIL